MAIIAAPTPETHQLNFSSSVDQKKTEVNKLYSPLQLAKDDSGD